MQINDEIIGSVLGWDFIPSYTPFGSEVIVKQRYRDRFDWAGAISLAEEVKFRMCFTSFINYPVLNFDDSETKRWIKKILTPSQPLISEPSLWNGGGFSEHKVSGIWARTIWWKFTTFLFHLLFIHEEFSETIKRDLNVSLMFHSVFVSIEFYENSMFGYLLV